MTQNFVTCSIIKSSDYVNQVISGRRHARKLNKLNDKRRLTALLSQLIIKQLMLAGMIKTKRGINLVGNSSSKTQLRLDKIKKAQCLLDWKFGPPGRELISINVFVLRCSCYCSTRQKRL